MFTNNTVIITSHSSGHSIIGFVRSVEIATMAKTMNDQGWGFNLWTTERLIKTNDQSGKSVAMVSFTDASDIRSAIDTLISQSWDHFKERFVQ